MGASISNAILILRAFLHLVPLLTVALLLKSVGAGLREPERILAPPGALLRSDVAFKWGR